MVPGLVIWRTRTGLPLAQTVIVHTKDGRSFVGVLVARYAQELVLRHARTLPNLEPIVGDVVIPIENFGWAQADVPNEMLTLNN